MSVADLANTIKQALENAGSRLPKPAKRKLSEAVAALVHAGSANTSKICDSLPDAPQKHHEREQWLFRLLSSKATPEALAIEPFARAELALAAAGGQTPVLCMDQTDIGSRHAILMVALRVGGRAVPLAWRVEEGAANVGSAAQVELLAQVKAWLPEGCKPILMGDRFYPSSALFAWLKDANFSWRIRLKGSLVLTCSDGRVGKVSDLAERHGDRGFFDSRAALFKEGMPMSVGWIWDKGHKEGWAVAMDCGATRASTLDYQDRWGIEPMFADFKGRGFDLGSSQMRLPERLSKMVLLVALAMRICMASGPEGQKKEA